jgi:hypothetical protein
MPSGPYYDNIREGGPDGIRKPMEVMKATYAVQKELNLGTVDATGELSRTLTPDETGATVIEAAPTNGTLTIIYPACIPGKILVVVNGSSTESIVVEVSGNTSNTATITESTAGVVVHTYSNLGTALAAALT